MPRRSILIFAAACLIAAAALAVAAVVAVSGRDGQGMTGPKVDASGQPLIEGDFDLVDFDGRPVDESILKGRWSVVFFGYTYCPDFCPTTLAMLRAVKAEMGPDGEALQVVFVSVDPERDTPQVLKDYLSTDGFPAGTLGLTGTPEQIRAAARSFGAYYAKKGEGETALFDHSLYIYLMGPDGEARTLFSESLSPEQAAGVIRRAQARG